LLLSASVSGQKFDDLNANGVRDPGELGLDGWTVELVELETGLVADTAVTASIDLDSSGDIDPETESGLYTLSVLDTLPPIGPQALQILENDSWPGAYFNADWNDTTATNSYSNKNKRSSFADSVGHWVFEGLPDAPYEIWVCWGQSETKPTAANVPYRVYFGGEIASFAYANGVLQDEFVIDQTVLPSDMFADGVWWRNLGIYHAEGVLAVEIQGPQNVPEGEQQFSFADAVRIEGTTNRYTVREVNQPGWVQSFPAIQQHQVILSDGESIEGKDFGNYQSASVSGQKFEDLDGDGVRDPGDEGLDGWTMELVDPAGGGVIDTQTTAGGGWYSFTDLKPGDYELREAPRSGWVQTHPSPAIYLLSLASGDIVAGKDFGNAELASISGMKFEDLDGDGVRDPGEEGLDGWTVELVDPVGGGVIDTQTTAAGGLYSFADLMPGDYELREAARPGWIQTLPIPAVYSLTLASGSLVVDKDFGNQALPGAISGRKFEDTDGNSVRDPGEPWLDGWIIELVDASSGLVIDTHVTSDGGMYLFDALTRGSYIVREVIQPGWAASAPNLSGYTVSIAPDETRDDLHFGNYRPVSISGLKFSDHNADGVRDAGEEGLDGWTIELVDPATGDVIDTRTTAGGGFYSFVGLTPGDYELREAVQPGWAQTHPSAGGYSMSLASGDTAGDRDFGNYRIPSMISGQKFEDVNGNTVQDPGEPWLDGWTIELVDSSSGLVIDTRVTSGGGLYAFGDLAPGSYIVREVVQVGWAASAPGPSGHTIDIAPGETRSDIRFGNYRPVSVSGLKFFDHNGDGVRDGGDEGLGGWTIELVDPATNGVIDTRTTASDGSYSFEDIIPGDYEVHEVHRFGWAQTYPSQDIYSLTLASGDPDAENRDFGNYTVPDTITGQLWNDLNADGVKDASEPGLDGWTVELTDLLLGDTTTTVTAAGGLYSFDAFLPGSYEVRQIDQAGWLQTHPTGSGYYAFELNGGAAGLDFGNVELASISGVKFDDLDGDGVKGAGEPGLNGWTILLVDSSTGQVVETAITATGTEAGQYSFIGVPPGDYEVREAKQAGWQQTFPAGGTYSFVLGYQDRETDIDFGNFEFASISGQKFEDADGDGAKDAGELGLDGWAIELVAGGTGEVVATAVTGGGGFYAFSGLTPGDYEVREVQQQGWRRTLPSLPTYSLTVISGDDLDDLDFGNEGLYDSISGQKYEDLDGDGVHDPGELGLDDWTIELVDAATGAVVGVQVTAGVDLDSDGTIDPETEAGLYSFQDLVPGAYKIREIPAPGWEQSFPANPGPGVAGATVLLNRNQWWYDIQSQAVAINSAGETVVAWIDMEEGSHGMIRAQRRHADGTPNGDSFLVNVSNEWQTEPCVALSDSGAFFIAYSEVSRPEARAIHSVFIRRYNADGTPNGEVTQVNTYATGDQEAPAISMGAAGDFVIVWQSEYQDGYGFGIFGRRFTAAGAPIGSEFQINTTRIWDQEQPAIAMADSGDFVVVWQSYLQDGDEYGISGQRFHADGTRDGDEFRVNTTTLDSQQHPAVGMDGAGNFAVVWKTYVSSQAPVTYYCQRYHADGTSNGPEFMVDETTLTDPSDPNVAMNDTGDFVIAWSRIDDPNGRHRLYAQRYTADGSHLGSRFAVDTGSQGWWQTHPHIALNDSGQFVVAWQRAVANGRVDGSTVKSFYGFSELGAHNAEINGLGQIFNDLDFGNLSQTGRLSGQVYEDPDLNGRRDAGEAGLDGWMLELVDPDTGAVIASTVTMSIDLDDSGDIDPETEAGLYAFERLLPGTYEVRQMLPSGWTQTAPISSNYSVTLRSAEEASGLDFGNLAIVPEIRGQKFEDLDGDGVHDPGEPGLDGWTIELLDAFTDQVVATTVTAGVDLDQSGDIDPETEAGLYSFTVAPGRYKIREVLKPGWIQTLPQDYDAGIVGPVVSFDDGGHPGSTAVAMNHSGDFVVAWGSIGQDATTETWFPTRDVFAQRYHADGTPAANVFIVNTFADYTQEMPDTAIGDSGDFIIVWNSRHRDWDFSDIRAQRYGADGRPVGTEFVVNTYDGGDVKNAAVARHTDGSFVIVWCSEGQDGDGMGVYARMFHADGVPKGTEFQVNTYTSGDQANPAISMDGTGNFTVVWQSNGQDGDGYGVYAQRFGADGAPDGGEFQINAYSVADQQIADVAIDEGGRGVVTWESYGQDGDDLGIYARMLNPDGTPNGDEFRVNTHTPGEQTSPSVTIADSGRFAITWSGAGPSRRELNVQKYDADGARVGSSVLVCLNGGHSSYAPQRPDIAADGSDRFVIAYQRGVTRVVFNQVTGLHDPGLYCAEVAFGDVVELDFGNFNPALVSGRKFEDLNGDGVQDPGESGLDGWTIELVDAATQEVVATTMTASVDLDESGDIDPETESGLYSFAGAYYGSFEVREAVRDGWRQTMPADGTYLVTLAQGDYVTGRNFGNYPIPSEIYGRKFEDVNANGVRDAGEPGLADWKIYLDLNTNGQWDPDEPFDLTDLSGNYELTDLPQGRYMLAEEARDGWRQVMLREEIDRVSDDSSGTQANAGSYNSSISADGRYVAFASDAYNLVAGDTNGYTDVFVYDRQRGQIERISVDSSGMQGDGVSNNPSISADGRYVAFESYASNLVTDGLSIGNVYVHDRQTGITECASVDITGKPASGGASHPSISANGRYVAFRSNTDNLVPGDSNDTVDIFVYNREIGLTERVSVDSGGTQANDDSAYPSISADGRYVAFETNATNLTDDSDGGDLDVFVYDRHTDVIECVSLDSTGAQGNDNSLSPSISADGRYVVFESYASNLVADDTNGEGDIFVHDRQTGLTERMSVDSIGTQGNDDSQHPSISADGRYVAFQSLASNLVTVDANAERDIFVHDRQTGKTECLSIDSAGMTAGGYSMLPSISPDGRHVAFQSSASNLTADDTYSGVDVFVATPTFVDPGPYHIQLGPDETLAGMDFGNYRPVSIYGRKFHDIDGDGSMDPLEPGLDDWTIQLVNPVTTAVIDTQTTADGGFYSFTDLIPGDYELRETLQGGWVRTSPSSGAYSLTLISGDAVGDMDFGNTQPGSISGMKFDDIDGNGLQDEGEDGLDGWNIELVDANTGQVVDTETTSAGGLYSFTGVLPGDYELREVLRFGWGQTYPQAGDYQLTLLSGADIVDRDFGNARLVSVSGQKFADLNSNGVRDSGELGLDGWTIELVDRQSGQVVATTVTASMDLNHNSVIDFETERGLYEFVGAFFGNYRIREVQQPGWTSTWPITVGDEFRVNTMVADDQDGADAAVAGSGRSVIVWQSSGQDGSGDGIYAQIYNADGTPDGAEFPVNTTTLGNQGDPSVAVDATGAFVIVWTDDALDGEGEGIFARMFDADGTPQTGEIPVNSYVTGDQSNPVVAMDSGGGFTVAWTDAAQDGSDAGIYARRFTSAGLPATVEFPVNATVAGNQQHPSLDVDVGGTITIAWDSLGQDGSGYGVYARQFDPAGTPSGGEFPVNTETASHQLLPSIAANGAGRFAIAWNSYGQDGDSYGVYAQRYNSDGSADGGEFRVNTETTSSQSSPSVAMDDAGNLAVVWVSSGQDGDGLGIYGQLYNSDGSLADGEFPINSYTIGNQVSPVAGMSGAGLLTAVWACSSQDGDGYGVYGRRLGAFDAPGYIVSLAPGQDVNGMDFGNYADLGSIRGQTFHDANVNRLRDPGEIGLDSWTVQLVDSITGQVMQTAVTGTVDVNDDGAIDPETEVGLYELSQIPPGAYEVREVAKPGWVTRYPHTVSYTLVVGLGQVIADIDFGNAVNSVPTVTGFAVATDEDTPVNGQVAGDDSDGDPLVFSVANLPVHGQVAIAADGAFTYTPEYNYFGSDSFAFWAWDGFAYSNIGTVSITIAPIGDVPIIDDLSLRGSIGATLTSQVSAYDPDGGPYSVGFAVQPAGPNHGTLTSFSRSTGEFTYVADAGYVGVDSFVVAASGGPSVSTPGTVSIMLGMWESQDIGSVQSAGSTTQAGSTTTIVAGGEDIWDYADEFHYAYYTLSGDGEIIAHVTSLEDASSWTKAGVMIRETLAADSKHAMMAVTPRRGGAFQRRENTGGFSLHTGSSILSLSYWVRLVRDGDSFTGYLSPDGLAWNPVGSDIIVMNEYVYVGLAATAHSFSGVCTATFEDVQIYEYPWKPIVAVDSLVTTDSTPSLSGEVDDPTATIQVSVDGNTYPAVNNGDGTWTLDDDTISPLLDPGIYDVAVVATNVDGYGVDGTVNELVVISPYVVGRYVFYNNSAGDGNNPAANAADDAAIDSGKAALLPGHMPGPANYTSYSRGINGVMVDIDGLTGIPTLDDFSLRMSDPSDPSGWTAAPTPAISVRFGQGVGGSDRVTLIWSEYMKGAIPSRQR